MTPIPIPQHLAEPAVGPKCVQCGAPARTEWFCGDACQRDWTAEQAGVQQLPAAVVMPDGNLTWQRPRGC